MRNVAARMRAEALKMKEKGNTLVAQGQHLEVKGSQDTVKEEQKVQQATEIQHQVAQELADAQAQTQALAPVTLRILELVELAEDVLQLVLGNAGPRVPYLDCNRRCAAPATRASR